MAKWWNKKTKAIVIVVCGVLGAAIAGFITYFSIPMRAEAKPLNIASNMATVRFVDMPGAVILSPATSVNKGILFYPGARIEPAAYAYKLMQVAQSGVAVIIAKPPLHVAALDIGDPSGYTNMVPSVTDWYVAGHSLGGVRACQVAGDGSQFKGLILMAAYCANTVSGTAVLSIGGGNDQLTTLQDIDSNKSKLPADTMYTTISGLNHAGFGNYGAQRGDGDMAIKDVDARDAMTKAITTFVGTAVKPE